MTHHRPDPDELLKAVSRESSARGRLKVFLGASAGVGKTFAMLSEARERLERGLEVVIGYVETHGRVETQALVEGLEEVPLKTLQHRGTEFRELNLEAILERAPALVLIDELPHTNAPGSRHAKRWQDVEEVLDAGIDVYTALNIQHLESLNDVVAQITGVRVQETVPDAFLDRADEIEVIDIPPTDLRQRLKEGKVYVTEKIEQALGGFFRTSNLTALRELALRKAADTVDAEVQRLKVQEGGEGPWATKERIIVCIAPNRLAARVVRAAARLGSSSHADITAVYVESDRQARRPGQDHASVQEALELASKLGMETATLHGHDIVGEVMAFAHRRNATLIVVGKPIRPRWREILFGSVVDELVRASGDVDVHVITAEESPSPHKAPVTAPWLTISLPGAAGVLLVVAVSTILGLLLIQGMGIANVAMIYLFGVAICALRVSRTESALAAVLSVLSFNFCFVEPRYTFAVSDARYLLLFSVMLAVGLVISTLTHQLRSQLQASSDRERRTQSLYSLSRQLAMGRGKREMAAAAVREIRGVFGGEAAVFLSQDGKLAPLAGSESRFEVEPNEAAVASWVSVHGVPAGKGTDTLPGSQAYYLPLVGSEATVGVLAYKPEGALPKLAQRQLLETFANALGLALERAVLAKASNDARVSAESERVRSTLLSSISHDLRTPLTSITGAASSIIEGNPNTKDLASAIYHESVRLNRQIQNLLDMTRLQSLDLSLKLEWHSPGDLASSAVRHAGPALSDHPLSVILPGDLPLLWVDGLLIEKALVNLLENAGVHTREGDPIEVRVEVEGSRLGMIVADEGPGFGQRDPASLFTLGVKQGASGYGLGLSVVKAVADLHGGSAVAKNRHPRGAQFELWLPLPPSQPEAPHG